MQNKIIVPTDFSGNSKAGIRFGIQLASQTGATLVFYHSMEIVKPVRWTNAQFKTYVTNQLHKTTAYLKTFVEKVYDQTEIKKGKYECVVERGADPRKSVVKYAVAADARAICMATRGAGKLKRVIGTNSSGILSTSPIPVFVIPNGYRKAPITNILYASDLGDFKSEIKRVREFSTSVKGDVYVYHYTDKLQEPETRKRLLTIQNSHTKLGVSFIFDGFGDQTFAENFEEDLKESNASLGVLFTNQKRKWFDKLFQHSNSAEVSFSSKVPILVFAKE
ncbi:MAG TPA: universal stress protein [Chryseosolibacter sp.]|nr:universal stress protein [Chryseosolibacter sp.]